MIDHKLRWQEIFILVAALFACNCSFGQNVDDSLWIKPTSLSEAGIHLPSFINSVDQQLSYQAGLPTHQELSLEWDSLAGHSTEVIKKEAVEGQTPRGDFRILERHQKIKGGSVSKPPMFIQDQMVAAAVSNGNEVRGLVVFWDPRASHSEDVARRERTDFITPSVNFNLWLPDDPTIRKVIFFRPVPGSNGKPRLEKIGELTIEPTHPPH
jgi:hypothetical protein